MRKIATEMVHVNPDVILEMISELQKHDVKLKQIAKYIGLSNGGLYYSKTKGNFSFASWKLFKNLYEKTTKLKSPIDESDFSTAASRAKIQKTIRRKKNVDISSLSDDEILKEIRNRTNLTISFLKEIRTDLLVLEVEERKKVLNKLTT